MIVIVTDKIPGKKVVRVLGMGRGNTGTGETLHSPQG